MPRRARTLLGVAALAVAVIGLVPASAGAGAAASCQLPRFGPGRSYHPRIDPADFSPDVTNPWFPLTPGRTLVYTGTKDGQKALNLVATTSRTKKIDGVTTRVVEDRLYLSNVLEERTSDYYAQDRCGNVWYFGEDTAECENGAIKNQDGAWQAGVDGAQPGVVMLADARVGDHYRQEYLAGEAEDQARVLKLDDAVTVPAGSYTDVLVTEDFTPLEPDLLEDKLYAPGVGVVEDREVKGGSGVVKLVEIVHGPATSGEAPPFDPCHE